MSNYYDHYDQDANEDGNDDLYQQHHYCPSKHYLYAVGYNLDDV